MSGREENLQNANLVVVWPETLGDLHSYNIGKKEWKALDTTPSSSPGIRAKMGMAATIGRIFIFGGNAGEGTGKIDLR